MSHRRVSVGWSHTTAQRTARTLERGDTSRKAVVQRRKHGLQLLPIACVVHTGLDRFPPLPVALVDTSGAHTIVNNTCTHDAEPSARQRTAGEDGWFACTTSSSQRRRCASSAGQSSRLRARMPAASSHAPPSAVWGFHAKMVSSGRADRRSQLAALIMMAAMTMLLLKASAGHATHARTRERACRWVVPTPALYVRDARKAPT